MSPGFLDPDYDPLDLHRRLILDAAQRAADYAEMVAKLINMRDDDRAYWMWGALHEEATKLALEFGKLSRARRAQPSQAAAAHFDRQPATPRGSDRTSRGDAGGDHVGAP